MQQLAWVHDISLSQVSARSVGSTPLYCTPSYKSPQWSAPWLEFHCAHVSTEHFMDRMQHPKSWIIHCPRCNSQTNCNLRIYMCRRKLLSILFIMLDGSFANLNVHLLCLCKYYVVHAHVICRICNLSFETCANWNGAEQCGNNDVFLSDASCDGDCPANCCQLRVCFLQKILRADCNANARVRFAPTTLSRVRRRNAGLMILPSYS